MHFSFPYLCYLLVAETLFVTILANEYILQGSLAFQDVERMALSSRSNVSSNFLKAFSPQWTRDILHSSVDRRATEECPPKYPLPCPDGIRCTTLDHDVCCADGMHSCETGGSCCDGGTHCTPVGGFCCGEYACEEGDTCCSGGCGTPRSTCCGSSHYCLPGQTCCGNGCADAGNSCCGTDHQCTAEEQCCMDGSNGCAPKDATCCGPEQYCIPGATCCIDVDNDYFCSPGQHCIDTLTLDLNEYSGMEEIFENMCRGILQSDMYNEQRSNEITLSYIGPGETTTAARHRREVGCAGSPCAKIFSEQPPGGEEIPWSCDEFPFATSDEGGSKAAMICVPAKHNSAMGGRWAGAVRGKSKGYQVRIKIKGLDCSQISLEWKRSSEVGGVAIHTLAKRAGAILKNDTDSEVIYINGSVYEDDPYSKVVMIIPLHIPDDFVGTFHLNHTITGGVVKSGSIIDDWGEDYGSLSIFNTGEVASKTIDIGPNGVGNVMMFLWTDDTKATLNYTTSLATSVVATETATLSPSSSPSSGSGSLNIVAARRDLGSLFCIAVVVKYFLS